MRVTQHRRSIEQDRANTSPDELLEFKKLAAAYARMTVSEVNIELRNGDLLEICHDEQGKDQE